jgi:acyl-coenzyme A thioesterase PaaI-like protein
MSTPAASPLPFPQDGHLLGAGQPCYGCSPDHPTGMRLTFAREGDAIVTTFTPGEGHQGPPGIMHGGLVTTLADEIADWTLLGLRERMGFTGAIDAKLLQAVRVGAPVRGRGRIASATARVTKIGVELSQGGAACFKGEFTFVLLDRNGVERLLGGKPLPEAWERFVR